MEPLDAVVRLTADSCEIWAGDQFQTVDQGNAARTAGLKPEQVKINTLYAGGSFGRRANAWSDYIVEAVSIAKALGANGVPVKLQWTREDDIHGGFYRPMYYHRLEAGLDADGKLVGWQHRIVGQSILEGTPFAAVMVRTASTPPRWKAPPTCPMPVPNVSVELSTTQVGVPVLWWRVVGSSHTVYAVEAFIDEAAQAAGKDPTCSAATCWQRQPRLRGVLELAAEKAGWDLSRPLPAGRGRGIAVTEAFKTFVAQVVEVSVDKDGKLKVERVVCAVDCGIPINPDVIAAQMEGGIGFGLGAILHSAITLKDGKVEQNNFDGYQVLRIAEMPKVEVHIVPPAKRPPGSANPVWRPSARRWPMRSSPPPGNACTTCPSPPPSPRPERDARRQLHGCRRGAGGPPRFAADHTGPPVSRRFASARRRAQTSASIRPRSQA